MAITRHDMTLTGNLADAPIVTAGFGADGVALQACTAAAATGTFGSPTRTAHAACTYAGGTAYVTRHRDQVQRGGHRGHPVGPIG